MRRGLTIGRFLPLHRGHELVLRAGLSLCERMSALVAHTENDPFPLALRRAWLSNTLPELALLSLETDLADAVESPAVLAKRIKALHPEPLDLVLGSAAYIPALAAALDAEAVLIDPHHEIEPVRASDLRAHVFAYWDALPEAVRPHFLKRVCLMGPESTGKSTLARKLAQHFGTLSMPEYGRTFETAHMANKTYATHDLKRLAETHVAIRKSLERRAPQGVLFEDTDPLITAVWSDMLCGARDPWFAAFKDTADLYLFTDMDTPFVQDGIRYFGKQEERRRFRDLCLEELENHSLPYVRLNGDWATREARAVEAVVQTFGLTPGQA